MIYFLLKLYLLKFYIRLIFKDYYKDLILKFLYIITIIYNNYNNHLLNVIFEIQLVTCYIIHLMIKFSFESTYKLYLPIHLIYLLLIKKICFFIFYKNFNFHSKRNFLSAYHYAKSQIICDYSNTKEL